MNKLIISGVVAVIVSYIGVAIKLKYKKRQKYLEDYMRFLAELIEEISFYKTPLCEFIDRVKDNKNKDFRSTLECYITSIETNKPLIIHNIYLRNEDIEIIQNCFNAIGITDSMTQLERLNEEKSRGETMLQRAILDTKSKGELYGKLGILLGLALMIILA